MLEQDHLVLEQDHLMLDQYHLMLDQSGCQPNCLMNKPGGFHSETQHYPGSLRSSVARIQSQIYGHTLCRLLAFEISWVPQQKQPHNLRRDFREVR